MQDGVVAKDGLEANDGLACFGHVGGVVHVRDLSAAINRRAGRPRAEAPPYAFHTAGGRTRFAAWRN